MMEILVGPVVVGRDMTLCTLLLINLVKYRREVGFTQIRRE